MTIRDYDCNVFWNDIIQFITRMCYVNYVTYDLFVCYM